MSTIQDYKFVKKLGKGKYGDVNLVEFQGSRFAMKEVKGGHAVERNQIEILKRLQICGTPSDLIIRLHRDFQAGNDLYLLLEYAPYGDLSTLIKSVKHFEESTARFYAMQAVLAVEYLHGFDVVHRDIKSENILIAANGYLKLADFGFSKVIPSPGRTYSLCGTTEYMAPEIIDGSGYDRSVDWWAIGVLIYEMASGRTPFKKRNDKETKYKIVNNIYKMPTHFSTQLKSLIKGFFVKNSLKRFGYSNDVANDFKDHPWFTRDYCVICWLSLERYFSWDGIRNQIESLPNQINAILKQYSNNL